VDRNDLISTRLSTVEYLLVQNCPVSLRSVEALAPYRGLHVKGDQNGGDDNSMVADCICLCYYPPHVDHPNKIDDVDKSHILPLISKQMPHCHNITRQPPKPNGNLPDQLETPSQMRT
jgi:hypothetical protein